MTKILCFGSFDVVHPGHLYYLRKSKEYGDELIVVVARDKNIIKIKKKKPKYNERQRLEHVKDLEIVDKTILGKQENYFEVIKEINPDIICLGYDQNTISFQDLKDLLEKNNIKAEVIRIDAYKEHMYKSSKLKEKE